MRIIALLSFILSCMYTAPCFSQYCDLTLKVTDQAGNPVDGWATLRGKSDGVEQRVRISAGAARICDV